MTKQQIKTLTDMGISITHILKKTNIPRSSYRYWYNEDQNLKEAYHKQFDQYLKELKATINEL